MRPSERLTQAHQAARDGDYAFALSEYVWYHEHALETEPSQGGVRMSYALAYWMELGAQYPAAIQALEDILARKTAVLRAGAGDWQLFDDVVAIGERLGRERATYELFLIVAAQRPDFAARCANLAIPAMLASGDFELARRYVGDTSERVKSANELLSMALREMPRRLPERTDEIREVESRLYVAKIQEMLRILASVGDTAEAGRVRELSIAVVADADIRERVKRGLDEA
jgi:hypothetical protein